MKTLYNTRILICLLLLGFLSSCNDDKFFEMQSPPETTWTTVEDLEFGITSVYRSFVNRDENATWMMHSFLHFGMSDIVREIDINGGYSSDGYVARDTKLRLSRNEIGFGLSYQTILRANNILDFLETNPFPNATAADKVLNLKRIEGEALFLRAMAYYHLVTWFAPAYVKGGSNDSKILPLRLNVPRDIETAQNNTPVETRLIYEQIVKDLQAASDKLPLKFLPGMHNAYQFGRANKHAAKAALARVFTLMDRYDEALVELNGVLDDPNLSRALLNDPEKVWTNNSSTVPWNDSEIVWYGFYADALAAQNNRIHELRLWGFFFNIPSQDPLNFNPFYIWSLNRPTLLSNGMLNTNNTIPASWTNDKRFKLYHYFKGRNPTLTKNAFRAQLTPTSKPQFLYLDIPAARVGADDPVVICAKYYRVPTVANTTTQAPQNIPLIRSAELYLWRAAIKKITGSGSPASDLNIVRSRSWDTALSGAYVPLTDGQISFQTIDEQWIKEMTFEGDRVIWLQMFNQPIGSGDTPSRGTVSAPAYDNFYWQIPISESDFLR